MLSIFNKEHLKQHLRLIKKLSNTEAELKKHVAYKRKRALSRPACYSVLALIQAAPYTGFYIFTFAAVNNR